MRVLVTGAAGFAGSHVVQTFEGAGHEVALCDIGDRLQDFGVSDVVVSLAATADPKDALRDPVAAYENNVRVMVETLEHARRVGARVLHVSTNEVYGNRVGPVYAPRGPYAGAKACQEIVCETYQDVPVTVVVTQSLFGERQQPNKLVPTAIRKLLAGEPIPLQCSGGRWAHRPFMHVRNLAEALEVLAHDETGRRRRVHVGASRAFSVRRVCAELEYALGVEADVVAVEAGGRAGHELDAEPIGCDLAIGGPRYQTLPALRDVACWYRDNPEWLESPDALPDSHTAHAAPSRQARRAA